MAHMRVMSGSTPLHREDSDYTRSELARTRSSQGYWSDQLSIASIVFQEHYVDINRIHVFLDEAVRDPGTV